LIAAGTDVLPAASQGHSVLGGEPLLMEEHLEIFKISDRKKLFHVQLHYETNFFQSGNTGTTDIMSL